MYGSMISNYGRCNRVLKKRSRVVAALHHREETMSQINDCTKRAARLATPKQFVTTSTPAGVSKLYNFHYVHFTT